MTVKDFCTKIAQAIVKNLLGVDMSASDPQVVLIVGDIEKQARVKYALDGMPYGETEEGLLQYLIGTTQIIVEE